MILSIDAERHLTMGDGDGGLTTHISFCVTGAPWCSTQTRLAATASSQKPQV